jgi:rhamnosyltransferase
VRSVSVVIPVKDGERYLGELLDALAREQVDETLVIDSGSRDRSVEIARAAAGVRVLEVPPDQFEHGRTRNLGAEGTSGELICFLTQDATPCAGWLAAYREAFELYERVGAAYGPHLPRADTSPMIARELTEFFASFAPDGRPAVQREGDATFLSNVNACYLRACWQEIRFREIAYSEDQAFGVDMLAAGWSKVYHPAAGVLHAHDYGTVEFMRRYFDEYRGLRESSGHVEPFGVLATARYVGRTVAADNRWMAERGMAGPERARWSARAVVHHGGRRVFSALGSRSERVPRRCARGCRSRAATARHMPPTTAPRTRTSHAPGLPRCRRPSTSTACSPTTTTRWSPASGARARPHSSSRPRACPSASGCASRS